MTAVPVSIHDSAESDNAMSKIVVQLSANSILGGSDRRRLNWLH